MLSKEELIRQADEIDPRFEMKEWYERTAPGVKLALRRNPPFMIYKIKGTDIEVVIRCYSEHRKTGKCDLCEVFIVDNQIKLSDLIPVRPISKLKGDEWRIKKREC